MTTTKEAPAKVETLVVFVPNKLSADSILINSDSNSELYHFLESYFFGTATQHGERKPWMYVGLMIEELEENDMTEAPLWSEDEHPNRYSSLTEYLKEVQGNFGESTIIICSDYN